MTFSYQDFIDSIGDPVRSFPPCLRQTYVEMMQRFALDPEAQGFDQIHTREGFGDPTLRGVAHRMYWWFPTHFFKFQESLLLWEQQCRKSERAFLLDRPRVTFVDLGCGAGAASAAVLATLEQYQCFCRANSVGMSPIEVRFIALDPVPLEVEVYERFIRAYAARIEQYKIFADIQTVCERFPHGTPEIVAQLSQLQGHVLIVGMSNLINWIWNEYDEYLSQGRLGEVVALNPAETDALRQLAERTGFDVFHVIGIAVQKERYWYLPQKLQDLLVKLMATLRLANRPFGARWGTEATVLFENPERSRWAREKPQANSKFCVENLVDLAPEFANDRKFRIALSHKNLEVAWAKVRCCMRYESLTDWVELKLFENDIEANIGRLREACFDHVDSALNVRFHLPYQFPKGVHETRPKSLPKLEEQIAAAAVSISFAQELDGPCPEVSYSYKLAPADSEFLYEFWFAAYRKYLAGVLRSLDGSSVLVTDIKSYYVNIRQAALLDTLRYRLAASLRCCELLGAVIDRDCGTDHDSGFGLLQGHALSGLFANVMLQPVDAQLVDSRGFRGRYFRFTDDITVTGIPGSEDPAEKDIIKEELSARDRRLKLNDDKTYFLKEQEFRKRNSGSREFDLLSVSFRALLLPVFLVNGAYRREFRRTDWNFVYEYQKLLEGIGVHFSPDWLHRKVDEYGKPLRRLSSLRRKWRLDWPSYSLISRNSGRRLWQQQFTRENPEWMAEKKSLGDALTVMLKGAAQQLIADNLSETGFVRQKRAVKFSLYRLSVFDVSSASSEVVQLLLSQPWSIPAGIACQALAKARQEDALEEVFRNSDFSYVRAMALRSLGKIRSDTSVSTLVSAMDGRASELERLMASEGLLDVNLWQNVESDTIKGWIQAECNHPYIQKNMIIILGQAYPEAAQVFLHEMDQQHLHPIVHQAIHYVLTKPISENLLWKAEPKILREYRAKFYPTIEELLGDRESYLLVS